MNDYILSLKLNGLYEETELEIFEMLFNETVNFKKINSVNEEVFLEFNIIESIKDFFKNMIELIKKFFTKIYEYIQSAFEKLQIKLASAFRPDLEKDMQKALNESYIPNDNEIEYINESAGEARLRKLFDYALKIAKRYEENYAKGMYGEPGEYRKKFHPDERTYGTGVRKNLDWYPEYWEKLEKAVPKCCESAKQFLQKDTLFEEDFKIDKYHISKEICKDIFYYYGDYDNPEKSHSTFYKYIKSGDKFYGLQPVKITTQNIFKYKNQIEEAAFNVSKWKNGAKQQCNETEQYLKRLQQYSSNKYKDEEAFLKFKRAVSLSISIINDITKDVQHCYGFLNSQALKLIHRFIKFADDLVSHNQVTPVDL